MAVVFSLTYSEETRLQIMKIKRKLKVLIGIKSCCRGTDEKLCDWPLKRL